MDEKQFCIARTSMIAIARDVWRASRMVEAMEESSDRANLRVIVTRLLDTLSTEGVESFDPTGQAYDPGLRYEIGFVERAGVESPQIISTVVPGVRISGELVAMPTIGIRT